MDSGSLDIEINQRLGILYSKHNDWLNAVSYNLCKNKDVSQDLVQELYLYLAEKKNIKLFFNDSFNLLYCHSFLSSRWINLVKRENKKVYPVSWKDTEDIPYNTDNDNQLQRAYDAIKGELDKLQSTSMWSSAKIYELYTFGDKTMEKLSDEIGISKSTTFLNVKKIKKHLKDNIKNPFDEQ
jgi:DNA-directed RNA polymerase specialized sigma24 family protein